ALVCIDIFSRFVYTEPLKTKESAEVALAFQRILRRARGATAIRGKTAAAPKEVSTDTGAEFRGAFSELLEKHGITQRFKEQINHLAVVDAAIRTLKTTMAKEMTAKGSDSWVKALAAATKAYNANSHSALMGTAPADVSKTPVLQYALEKQSGLDEAHNSDLHTSRVAKLRAAGAFRLVLPRSTWVRSGQPRYSEKVYELDHFVGTDVVATDGTRRPVRDALAVPRGSQEVKVPRELKGGRPIRDEGAKLALRPFATALRGFLGPTGSLTLQGAGTKLRGVPGFSAAMAEQRIAGNGALKRFLALFPEFKVEGVAPKATVRLA
ncbi:MAG: transposase family protein, partial [Sulfitobacter sp.]|nr:transposase family protein [Sulfitobacter sp.]